MVLIRSSPVTAGTRCYTPPTDNEALRRAADADDRSVSGLALRILRAWLEGYNEPRVRLNRSNRSVRRPGA